MGYFRLVSIGISRTSLRLVLASAPLLLARGAYAQGTAGAPYCGGGTLSLEARVASCAGAAVAVKVSKSGVRWNLVAMGPPSPGGPHEVWRDSRTGLLWGDRLDGTFKQGDAITFAQAGSTVRVTEERACASPTAAEAHVHLPEPFGMPTFEEYAQAEKDGAREVLPHFNGDDFWSGTLLPTGDGDLAYDARATRGFIFHSRDFGNLSELERTAEHPVRCVSRVHALPDAVAATTTVLPPLAGRVECGVNEPTVAEKLRACAALPHSEKVGPSRGARWNLVTRRRALETGRVYEVWRDEKTGLLWGDRLARSYTHYEAVRLNDDGTSRQEIACASLDGRRANGHITDVSFKLPTREEIQAALSDEMSEPLRDHPPMSVWTEPSQARSGRGGLTMAFVGSDGGSNYRLLEWPVRCVSSTPVLPGVPIVAPPVADCGTSGTTVEERVRACGGQPESTWESESHVIWRLVARRRDPATGKRIEVWQDSATGLVWGDMLQHPYDFHAAEKACTNADGARANAGVPGHFRLPTSTEFARAEADGSQDVVAHMRSSVFWGGGAGSCAGENWIERHEPHMIGSNPDAGRGTALLYRPSGNDGPGITFCDAAVSVRCVSP